MRAVGIPDTQIEAAAGLLQAAFERPRPGSVGVRSAGSRATSDSMVDSFPTVLDLRSARSSSQALKRRDTAAQRQQTAQQHFESALTLEESDAAGARAGYFAALEAHRDNLEARINLGRLLHSNGEFALAEKVYRDAQQASAVLSFNLAILLEDLGREAEAVVAYRQALTLDPSLHDAHFNLSRLDERADRSQDALRHLLAYRRHVKEPHR